MPEVLILPPAVLAFAPTDPSGGGGMQGDVLAMAAMGCYPLGVTTSIGVGDTGGMTELVALEAHLVQAQARAILEDIPVAALKIAYPASLEIVLALAEILGDYVELPMVLVPEAPVRGGDDAEMILAAMTDLLLPFASVVVAGRRDAVALYGAETLRALEQGGDQAALLPRGGHLLLLGDEGRGPQVVDTLFGAQGALRTDARATGGLGGRRRGDALGAALAAALARGVGVAEAVGLAQAYAAGACTHPLRIGMGAAVPRRQHIPAHHY